MCPKSIQAKRIIVTGGSDIVGRHVIEYLIKQGHQVLNLDITPLTGQLGEKVHTLRVDLSRSGQTFSALGAPHFQLSEPFKDNFNRPVDAIIHLGGYARNLIASDVETFRGNVLSTWNVLEAACKLNVKKVVLASSICVYGITYAAGDRDWPSFPIDEDTETDPTDPYGLSKLCAEKMARGFAGKYGTDIYVLLIGAKFKSYLERPSDRKVHGWSYTDARDLGKMCHLAIEKNGLGFQVFNAVNNEITNRYTSTAEFLKQQCPQTPLTRPIVANTAPISNQRIKEHLGFEQDHHWMTYYDVKQDLQVSQY